MFSIFLAGALLGYFAGKRHILDKYLALRSVARENAQKNEFLETELTALNGQIQTLERELEQLEGEYKEAVPDEELTKVIAVLKRKIKQGVSADRLSLILNAARQAHNCSTPATQPLLVYTSLNLGPKPKLDLDLHGLSLEAHGTPAMNSETNKEETWFDPGKPVELFITHASGDTVQTRGLLPLEYTMITTNKEFRFVLSEGARSFVDVSFSHCSYP